MIEKKQFIEVLLALRGQYDYDVKRAATLSEIYGIDISKDVFDFYGSKQGHLQFKNDEFGFKNFAEIVSKNSLAVMEASGYYHDRFAQFLYKKGVVVSVVNPLSIKRFIQMKLAKVKTDKSKSHFLRLVVKFTTR
jgi:transposase